MLDVQLTVEWHPEEKPVGDVHHDGSQQIESIHMSRGIGHLLQAVQVFGCGAHTDFHRSLEAGACQSCKTTMKLSSNAVKQCFRDRRLQGSESKAEIRLHSTLTPCSLCKITAHL